MLRSNTYQIQRFISAGGFGNTYVGFHTELEDRVAIKEFFVKDFCSREPGTYNMVVNSREHEQTINMLRATFLDEARALRRLSHPGIVRVTDAFQENNTVYYVMELIPGKSLKEILEQRGPMPEKLAIGYIRRVAMALKYLHDRGRLHLDIKPGNILLNHEGNPVLIDFGCSKLYVNGKCRITGVLTKTPGYASPEQMRDELQDFNPSMDVYSLAATLYKLLTGKTPLNAMRRLKGEPLLPLPSNISEPVAEAIMQALALNPKSRIKDMQTFVDMLNRNETEEGGIEVLGVEHGGKSSRNHPGPPSIKDSERLKIAQELGRLSEDIPSLNISEEAVAKLKKRLGEVGAKLTDAPTPLPTALATVLRKELRNIDSDAHKIEAKEKIARLQAEMNRRNDLLTLLKEKSASLASLAIEPADKKNIVDQFNALVEKVNSCPAGTFEETKADAIKSDIEVLADRANKLVAEYDSQLRDKIAKRLEEVKNNIDAAKIESDKASQFKSRINKINNSLKQLKIGDLSSEKADSMMAQVDSVEKDFGNSINEGRKKRESLHKELKAKIDEVEKSLSSNDMAPNDSLQLKIDLTNLRERFLSIDEQETTEALKKELLKSLKAITDKADAARKAESKRKADALAKAKKISDQHQEAARNASKGRATLVADIEEDDDTQIVQEADSQLPPSDVNFDKSPEGSETTRIYTPEEEKPAANSSKKNKKNKQDNHRRSPKPYKTPASRIEPLMEGAGDEPQSDNFESAPAGTSKKKLPLIIGGSVAAAVLIGVIVFFSLKPSTPVETADANDVADSARVTQSEQSPKEEFVENVSLGSGDSEFTYTGKVINGLPEDENGKGVYKTGVYNGIYKNGIREGKGTFTYSNGDLFEGTFKKDEFEKGVISLKSGDRFEGSFNLGEPYNGTWKLKNGETVKINNGQQVG